MLRLFAILILFLPLCSLPFVINKKDFLAPINIFSFLYLMKVLIPALLLFSDKYLLVINKPLIIEAIKDDSTYFSYALLQTISYYLIAIGSKLSFTRSTKQSTPSIKVDQSNSQDFRHFLFWGTTFTIIGFVVFGLIMENVGGLSYFISNLGSRTTILRDLDIFSWLINFLHIGPLMILYSYHNSNKKPPFFLYILIFVAGLLCGLGGRKLLIMMMIETLFIYHYTIRPINFKNLFSLKNFILLFAIFLFFIGLVELRKEGGIQAFLSNPVTFFVNSSDGIFNIWTRESYVSFFITIIYYFKTHALWLGTSFLGLLTAFIPSSIYINKPPVDDGMYLYSITLGRNDIHPVMPVDQLNISSFPLETFGAMYANFGVIGLLISMFLLGLIYNKIYNKLKDSNYKFLYLVIYVQILVNFEFSTLRIMQLLSTILLFSVLVLIVNQFKIKLKWR